MALDILHDNWGPYTHTEVENALKAYLAVLEGRINQAIQEGGVGLSGLSLEVQALLSKANTALQPENIAAWAKAQNKPGYTANEITGVEGFQNLLAKLQDMDAKIQAAAASGGVDPDDEMSSTSVKPVQNKVIKAYVDNLIAGLIDGAPAALDTLKELATALGNNSDAIATIINTLSSKANAADVVKSISVNGTAQTKDGNGNVNIEVAADVSVTTDGEGTIVIHVGDTSYPINLNHTHEHMAKLVICEESDLPSTLDMDTIYAQVDNATDPGEIQSLWIAGLEFVGGGGSEDDGLPKMSTPKDGNTINMGAYAGSVMTKEIVVRAKNLNYGGSTTGLTVEAAGTGLSLTYGQTTGTSVTIPQADAMIGVRLTINYSGTGALSDGELRFKQGSSELAVVVVVVVVAIPSELVQDTAWCAATGEHFSAPETQAGYCTTPFYQLTHDSNRNVDFIVKAGYVTPTDLARGMFVVKTNSTDTQTQGAYLNSSDPRRKQVQDANPNQINYLSATFKTSEWADCYIYDFIAGAYLFAGANVDTSTPPQMINPT